MIEQFARDQGLAVNQEIADTGLANFFSLFSFHFLFFPFVETSIIECPDANCLAAGQTKATSHRTFHLL